MNTSAATSQPTLVEVPNMTPIQHRLVMAVELAVEQACADPVAGTVRISRNETFDVLVSLACVYAMMPIEAEEDVGPETVIARAEEIISDTACTFSAMSADELAAARPSIITGFARSFVA